MSMSFSDRITSITDPPAPKGTAQYLTPTEYTKLDEKAQRFYRAEWERYKTKHRRQYEECDLGHTHFMGWEEYQEPIGEPYRYCWHQPLFPGVVDQLLNSNVLMTRMLNRWPN